MARRPPLAMAVDSGPEELEAEFYEALKKGDLERLMAVWADDDDIVCVQPGSGRAIGAAAVRAAFAAALAADGSAAVRAELVHRLLHLGSALHHLVEHTAAAGPAGRPGEPVLASHLYVKTLRGWRLAARHASPGDAQALPADDSGGPTTLH